MKGDSAVAAGLIALAVLGGSRVVAGEDGARGKKGDKGDTGATGTGGDALWSSMAWGVAESADLVNGQANVGSDGGPAGWAVINLVDNETADRFWKVDSSGEGTVGLGVKLSVKSGNAIIAYVYIVEFYGIGVNGPEQRLEVITVLEANEDVVTDGDLDGTVDAAYKAYSASAPRRWQSTPYAVAPYDEGGPFELWRVYGPGNSNAALPIRWAADDNALLVTDTTSIEFVNHVVIVHSVSGFVTCVSISQGDYLPGA